MPERKKFEPEKISVALKLLRALPVKDTRKTLTETLRMLEEGILGALDKGYDRLEIRKTIAAAEVVISATSFNDFLAENLKDVQETGRETSPKRKKTKGKTETELGANGNSPSAKTENPLLEERKSPCPENGNGESGKRHNEQVKTETAQEATGKAASAPTGITPGSIVIKPDTPREEL